MEATLPSAATDNKLSSAKISQIVRDLQKYQNSIKDKLREHDDANFDSECNQREQDLDRLERGEKVDESEPRAKRTNHTHNFTREFLEIVTKIGSFNTKLRLAVEKNGIPLNKDALADETNSKGNTYNKMSDELRDILTKAQPVNEDPELVEPKDMETVEPALISKSGNTSLQFLCMSKLATITRKHVLLGAEEAQLSHGAGLLSYFVKDPLRDEFQVKCVDFKDGQDKKLGLQVQRAIKEKMTLHFGNTNSAYFTQGKKQANIYQVKAFTAENPLLIKTPLGEYTSSESKYSEFASEDCCFAAYEHFVAVATKTPNQLVQVSVESVEDDSWEQTSRNIDTGLKAVNNLYIRHFGIHLIGGKPLLIALDAAGSLFVQRVDQTGKLSAIKGTADNGESLALFVQENRKILWVLRKPQNGSAILDEYAINEEDAKLTLKPQRGRYEIPVKMTLTNGHHIKLGVLSAPEPDTQVVLIFNLGANRIATAQFTRGKIVGSVSESDLLRTSDSAAVLKELRLQTSQIAQAAPGRDKFVLSFTPSVGGSKKAFGLSGALEFQVGTVVKVEQPETEMEMD